VELLRQKLLNQKEEGNKKDKYVKELEERKDHIVKGKQQLYEIDTLLSKLLQEACWVKDECDKTSHRRINEVSIEKMKFDLKKLKEELAYLTKRVNPDVNELVNQTEQDLDRLKTRKQIIETDKLTIENVIKELEVKKKQAVEDAYATTNEFIQSIYSTLLPGAKARIDMVNKANLDEGIELKVQFLSGDDVSLNELSGGQRSLLALSFILSLLKLKPAPFYILDEIDAALDTSHTNNIGSMIKSHFEESQFIVISLKPEMFKQANVRYDVLFKDGISQVDRVKQKQ
jgi:structural maintenance of chromosome 2